MPAQILAIRAISSDRLLAVFTRPRDPRAPARKEQSEFTPGRESEATAFKDLGEWLVAYEKEVEQVLVGIDPTSGSVLREIPVTGMLVLGFLSDSLLFGVRLSEDGASYPVIHHIPPIFNTSKEN